MNYLQCDNTKNLQCPEHILSSYVLKSPILVKYKSMKFVMFCDTLSDFMIIC